MRYTRTYGDRDPRNSLSRSVLLVTGVDGQNLVGVLRNEPSFDVGYQFNDRVTFPVSEIEMIDMPSVN